MGGCSSGSSAVGAVNCPERRRGVASTCDQGGPLHHHHHHPRLTLLPPPHHPPPHRHHHHERSPVFLTLMLLAVVMCLLVPRAWCLPVEEGAKGVWRRWAPRERRELIDDNTVRGTCVFAFLFASDIRAGLRQFCFPSYTFSFISSHFFKLNINFSLELK